MRIVLDTNVLIAALIARGTCHELLEHCVVRHELITSEFILNELREKLIEKFKYPDAVADEAIAVLRSRMEVITPSTLEIPTCRDADDDNVLAAAVAASSDCISPATRICLCCIRTKRLPSSARAPFWRLKAWSKLVPTNNRSESRMKEIGSDMNDELRPEYDLRSLSVRKLGPGRKSFKTRDRNMANRFWKSKEATTRLVETPFSTEEEFEWTTNTAKTKSDGLPWA